MGTTIASTIATVILLVILVVGYTTSYRSQMQLTLDSQAALALQGQRVRTSMNITNIQVTGNKSIAITVLNNGSMDIRNFAQMDVVVNYLASSGWVTARLQYTAGPTPGNNQWSVGSVAPQPTPGVWQPSASLTINATIAPDRSSVGSGTFVLTAPNGVSTSVIF